MHLWAVCSGRVHVFAEHDGILGSVSLSLQQAMAAEQLSLALIFFSHTDFSLLFSRSYFLHPISLSCILSLGPVFSPNSLLERQ